MPNDNDTKQNDSPLVAALHTHIQSVAARPIDLRMLIELEKTCLLAREMLMVGAQPDAMMKRRMVHPMPMAIGGDDYGVAYGGGGMLGGGGFMAGAATSSPNETFGVTAIRELVNALSALQPKPVDTNSFADLTTAIIAAKNDGDTELEKQLRDTLRRKSGNENTVPFSITRKEWEEGQANLCAHCGLNATACKEAHCCPKCTHTQPNAELEAII